MALAEIFSVLSMGAEVDRQITAHLKEWGLVSGRCDRPGPASLRALFEVVAGIATGRARQAGPGAGGRWPG
jgi:hypothetical protein